MINHFRRYSSLPATVLNLLLFVIFCICADDRLGVVASDQVDFEESIRRS